jgi:hypothetical protein
VGGSQRFHIEQFSIRSLLAVKLFAVPGSHPSVFQANIELDLTLWNPGASSGEQHGGCNDAASQQMTPDSNIR